MVTAPVPRPASARGGAVRTWMIVLGAILTVVALGAVDLLLRTRRSYRATVDSCTKCGVVRHRSLTGLPGVLGWGSGRVEPTAVSTLLADSYRVRCMLHSWTTLTAFTVHPDIEEGHPMPRVPGKFAPADYLRDAVAAHPAEMRCVFALVLDPSYRKKFRLDEFIDQTFSSLDPGYRLDRPPRTPEQRWGPAADLPDKFRLQVQMCDGDWEKLMAATGAR